MKSPKVCIVVPTYNRLDLLKKAVDSVLAQSFHNYELIISDNCSSDGTEKWVKLMVKKNKNIRYLRNKTNLGMISNWNSGLLNADGEYIALLMDDDYWERDFLKDTVRVLNSDKSLGLVSTDIHPIFSSSVNSIPHDYYRLFRRSRKVDGVDCIIKYIKSSWLVGLPSAVLIRRKCFNELGLFDPVGLDQEMWLRICSKYNYYYIDKKLCTWRLDTVNNYTSTLKARDSIYRRIRTLDKIIGYNFEDKFISDIVTLCRSKQSKLLKEYLSYSLNRRYIREARILYGLYEKSLLVFTFDYEAIKLTVLREKLVDSFETLLYRSYKKIRNLL